MAHRTELQLRTNLLREFIDTNPIVVDLTRPTFSTSAAGGAVRTGETVIADQKFFFLPFFRRLTNEIDRNPQSYGEDRSRGIEYTLIFIPGETDVKEGDLFSIVDEGQLQPGDYRVHFVSKRQWDRQQCVVRLRD